MKTLNQIAIENGYEYRKVMADEFEDGVGCAPGDNWIREHGGVSVWRTTNQMLNELEMSELKIKSASLDASVGVGAAKEMALTWAKEQGAAWGQINRAKSNGEIILVSVMYGM